MALFSGIQDAATQAVGQLPPEYIAQQQAAEKTAQDYYAAQSGTRVPQELLDYWKGYDPNNPQGLGEARWAGETFEGYAPADTSKYGGWYHSPDSLKFDDRGMYTDAQGYKWLANRQSDPSASSGGDSGVVAPMIDYGYRRGYQIGDDPGKKKGVDVYYNPEGAFSQVHKDEPGWLNPLTGILAVATFGLGAQYLAAANAAGALGGAEAAGAGAGGAAGAGGGAAASDLAAMYGVEAGAGAGSGLSGWYSSLPAWQQGALSGAAKGGLTSGLTGGNPWKGALLGGLSGGVGGYVGDASGSSFLGNMASRATNYAAGSLLGGGGGGMAGGSPAYGPMVGGGSLGGMSGGFGGVGGTGLIPNTHAAAELVEKERRARDTGYKPYEAYSAPAPLGTYEAQQRAQAGNSALMAYQGATAPKWFTG